VNDLTYTAVVITCCIVALLIATSIFLKFCGKELSEWRKFFRGIMGAALKEMRFEGGKAGTANVILWLVLAMVALALSTPRVITELRNLFRNVPENSAATDILLIALLGVFFLVSVYYVYSIDRYEQMRKK